MFFRKKSKSEVQFTSQTRDAVKAQLIANYDFFLKGSLDFLRANAGSYFSVAFENISSKKAPYNVELQHCENFILNSSEDISNTVFQFKSGNGWRWWENEVKFTFIEKMPVAGEWGTAEYDAHLAWREELEYVCEYEFWEDERNKQAYATFSALNIFDDKIFQARELSAFENKREYLLDKTVWFKYTKTLITMFFPDFTYNLDFSNKKTHRFLRPLKSDFWFGFEFGESEMSYQLKKGIPHIPDYLNLVVINTSFNKNEKLSAYYAKHNSSIISLGILGNPFFYHPCFPMLGFSAVDSERKHGEGKTYRKSIIQLDEDNYQLIHPARYGESMKRHAFFYLSLLSSTSKIYLDYLSIVLQKAIN